MNRQADPEQDEERRFTVEPPLFAGALINEFPDLKPVPEGTGRAKAVVRLILKEYFVDAAVKAALTEKPVRHFAGYEGEMPARGYTILSTGAGQTGDQPAIDGQALFHRYVDSDTAETEDVKDVLFAIRREASRLSNTGNAKLATLKNLASLAIFELQQQRRRDVGV